MWQLRLKEVFDSLRTNFTELRNKDVNHTNATIEDLKLKHSATATELHGVITKMYLQNKSLTAQLEYIQTSSLPTAVARVAEDTSNLVKALSTAQGATIAQTMRDLKVKRACIIGHISVSKPQ